MRRTKDGKPKATPIRIADPTLPKMLIMIWSLFFANQRRSELREEPTRERFALEALFVALLGEDLLFAMTEMWSAA